MSEMDEIENNSVVRVIEGTLRTLAGVNPISGLLASGWSEYKNYVQENKRIKYNTK